MKYLLSAYVLTGTGVTAENAYTGQQITSLRSFYWQEAEYLEGHKYCC